MGIRNTCPMDTRIERRYQASQQSCDSSIACIPNAEDVRIMAPKLAVSDIPSKANSRSVGVESDGGVVVVVVVILPVVM